MKLGFNDLPQIENHLKLQTTYMPSSSTLKSSPCCNTTLQSHSNSANFTNRREAKTENHSNLSEKTEPCRGAGRTKSKWPL